MTTPLHCDAAERCKFASEDLPLTFDFRATSFLATDPITSAAITILSGSGLSASAASLNSAGTMVQTNVSGGTAGTTYRIRCVATTDAGRDLVGLVDLLVVAES